MKKAIKNETCAECFRILKVSSKRTECTDMCDSCWDKLTERVKHLSNRENRMGLARAATHFASQSFSENVRLRCFFAAVMPEIPINRVNKIVDNIKRR